MSREFNKSELRNSLIEKYWDYFYKDYFLEALEVCDDLILAAANDSETYEANEFKAKILLKQGKYYDAYDLLKYSKKYSGFKVFLEFLIEGDLRPLLTRFKSDTSSKIYKAFSCLLSKVYWGISYVEAIDAYEDPDQLLEEAFQELIDEGKIDFAILTFAKSVEIALQDAHLSKDLVSVVSLEQIDTLIKLAEKAEYDSTRAKLFLLKSLVTKDREAAEDAEILFGKEKNKNGLAEVYLFYANEFSEEEYYSKAINLYSQVENNIALALINSILASQSLINGNLKDAQLYLSKAKEKNKQTSVFDRLNVDIQELSLLSIQGKYDEIDSLSKKLLGVKVPKFFQAQAVQIFAGIKIKTGGDTEEIKEIIDQSCEQFRDLKRFHHLLQAENIRFQELLLEGNLEDLTVKAQEIIKLASKLGNHEEIASKYVDLAYGIINIHAKKHTLNEENFAEAIAYFEKAIDLFKEHENKLGEANIYQAMGDLFANIGKFEDSLNSLIKAKKIFKSINANLQNAITETLIGILILNPAVLNEHTYPIAQDHLERSYEYFANESILDISWKTLYYLADLNMKFFIYKNKKEKEYLEKTKDYFLKMKEAITVYESNSMSYQPNDIYHITNISTEQAKQKAFDFFISLGDKDNAKLFKSN
ncbi:MAG: tetratricopeptide repeat protein [Candidatus Caenarcaniphilales bacterium]|nr:tetratricopeptide repeat protein [Candidatus Caenarcaniphilales bacterium]